MLRLMKPGECLPTTMILYTGCWSDINISTPQTPWYDTSFFYFLNHISPILPWPISSLRSFSPRIPGLPKFPCLLSQTSIRLALTRPLHNPRLCLLLSPRYRMNWAIPALWVCWLVSSYSRRARYSNISIQAIISSWLDSQVLVLCSLLPLIP